ncbi:tRNA-specific adenosine deaminase [Nocardioides flavus (ex Wang et al. 2016)]|uniref:tRNA-specific adenosine deaminase n=1 Tax=Nocardioides flavus (ex Wang et al. 2016) TaxID=2058780 RepID=A0ABQ3HGG3_9ACTN|nr:nucleoside deaminase [Nocardioides flavus (ex Wang et al. 2016)]GHE16700.1 tRNA-specific adenosine deaminase [Nocardioides flavus (ex Wang et al. 2016)]
MSHDLSSLPGFHDHLERCLRLAEQALETGNSAFGSVLVDATGTVLATGHNEEVSRGDGTAHPEIELAQWAAAHVPAEERGSCVVFTSGEHCPMCAAAHAWVGLGPIVYAASSEQLVRWHREWGVPAAPVAALPVTVVAPGVRVHGPVAPYDERVRALHERRLRG